jgi:cell division protein FtsB
MIDMSVKLGDLLVMLSLLGTCLWYAFRSGRFAESILTMQKEISELKDVAKENAKVLVELAVQQNRLDGQAARLNTLDQRIEDLRRGDGFIAGRRGVDRPYPEE